MQARLDRLCAATGWTHAGNRLTVALPDGRTQSFVFEPYRDGNVDSMRVYTVLGPASKVDDMRLRAALRLNWQLRHGALAVGLLEDDGDEQLVLVDIWAEADEPNLSEVLRQMAMTADRYEQLVFGTDDH